MNGESSLDTSSSAELDIAVAGLLRAVWSRHSPPVGDSGSGLSLKELGLTSMQVVDLAARLEEHFEIEFSQDELLELDAQTLSRVAEMVRRKTSALKQHPGGTE